MTRLTSQDVIPIACNLESHERQLREKTGLSMWQLACRAILLPEGKPPPRSSLMTAVVPITAGLGVIEGFAGAVAAIARHLGFPVFVTAASDVAGFAEALEKGASLLLMADDERFVAYNSRLGLVVDNAAATGAVFAAALEQMAGGLQGEEVLVIGCGRVGASAARRLIQAGARVLLCDIDPRRSEDLRRRLEAAFPGCGAASEREPARALSHCRLIVDACPAPAFIDRQHVDGRTVVVSPGVPHGLTTAAREALGARFLHDSLELGVAAMLAAAAAGYSFPALPRADAV